MISLYLGIGTATWCFFFESYTAGEAPTVVKYIFIRKENKLYKSPLTTHSCGTREEENLREGFLGKKESLSS